MVAPATELLLEEPSLIEGALVIGAPVADVSELAMAARHFSFFEDAALVGAVERDAAERDATERDVVERDVVERDVVERGVAPALGDEQTVVLYLPKGTRRRDYALSLCARQVRADGTLLVVGERKGGIKGARKALRDAFASVQVRRVGHHCQLLQASGASLSDTAPSDPAPSDPAPSDPARTGSAPNAPAMASSSPGAADPLNGYEARWDTGLGFEAVSLPGTFAEGRLDDGTARLLSVCQSRRPGRALDLASGSGVVGVHLKRQRPADEWLLADADHLAVEASRRTATLAGVDVSVLASDAYSSVPGRFECILSNPPFHQGVGTDQSVPRRFVLGAPEKLTPEGELWLVANHFLPYEGWMKEAFESVESVLEDSRFKVLVGRRPRRAVRGGTP